jgi:electron transfer flavoprotein alpha/beta subunit
MNEPRYVKRPDIMMAKNKPLYLVSLQDLGVKPETPIRYLEF